MADVHPPLELHIIDDGAVTNTVTGAAGEFLGEEELVVGIRQLATWAPNGKRNSLNGREPRTEEAKKLGIVSTLVYSETAELQRLHLLIMNKDYVDDFINCARKPAQSSKGRGQERVERKGTGKSQAQKIVSKEQARKSKGQERWHYEEVDKEQEKPQEVVVGRRSRVPSSKVVDYDSDNKSNATPKQAKKKS